MTRNSKLKTTMDLSLKNPYNNGMFYAGFNQDQTCFCVGTDSGFRIYNSDPLRCQETQELEGGVRCAEMLFRWRKYFLE